LTLIGALFEVTNIFSQNQENLSIKIKDARATSVYVSENDVYVVGYQQYEPDKETLEELNKKYRSQEYSPERADDYYEHTKIVAKLWKNGVVQDLSDGNKHTFPLSVFVANNDVYVVGFEYSKNLFFEISPGVSINARVAKLWKNGIVQNLSKNDGKSDAIANSVFASGRDVFVAGYEFFKIKKQDSLYGYAKLWKNGIESDFPKENGSIARSVFVSGSDVYVAGNRSYKCSSTSENYQYAILWKNGVEQNLNGDIESAIANSVYVKDRDVYVAGVIYLEKTELDQVKEIPVLWKNGILQYLNIENIDDLQNDYQRGKANSVYVSESGDVYVVGFVETFAGDRNISAVLWKNGVAQKLNDDGYFGIPAGGLPYNSVFVSQKDIYVTGREERAAVLFKNGIARSLTEKSDNFSYVIR
jgi:hypothetical protein